MIRSLFDASALDAEYEGFFYMLSFDPSLHTMASKVNVITRHVRSNKGYGTPVIPRWCIP